MNLFPIGLQTHIPAVRATEKAQLQGPEGGRRTLSRINNLVEDSSQAHPGGRETQFARRSGLHYIGRGRAGTVQKKSPGPRRRTITMLIERRLIDFHMVDSSP